MIYYTVVPELGSQERLSIGQPGRGVLRNNAWDGTNHNSPLLQACHTLYLHNYTHFQEDLRGVEAVGGEPGEEGAGERGEELPHPEGTLTEEVRGTTEVVRGTIQMQLEVLYRSSQGRRKKTLEGKNRFLWTFEKKFFFQIFLYAY